MKSRGEPLAGFDQDKAKSAVRLNCARELKAIASLVILVFPPPLADGYRHARGLLRLGRSRIQQVVDFFQDPPSHFHQFFPDTAFMLRH